MWPRHAIVKLNSQEYEQTTSRSQQQHYGPMTTQLRKFNVIHKKQQRILVNFPLLLEISCFAFAHRLAIRY